MGLLRELLVPSEKVVVKRVVAKHAPAKREPARKVPAKKEPAKHVPEKHDTHDTPLNAEENTATWKDQNKLGEGGYGAVYKSVLKIRTGDPGQLAAHKVAVRQQTKLAREIRTLQTLTEAGGEEHVVEIFCGVRIGSTYHIFSELMHGDVNDLIKRNRNHFRDSRLFRSFTVQTLEGLKFIHAQEYIHQDIKPDNILYIHHHGRYIYKYGDFGISFHNKAKTRSRGGTPGYMSPEYTTNTVSFNSDIWSLGITFACLVVQRSDFIQAFNACQGVAKTAFRMALQEPLMTPYWEMAMEKYSDRISASRLLLQLENGGGGGGGRYPAPGPPTTRPAPQQPYQGHGHDSPVIIERAPRVVERAHGRR